MKIFNILLAIIFWRVTRATARIFDIGIGRTELADIVSVKINESFSLNVRLNSAKGSVPIGRAKGAKGFYASEQKGYLVDSAHIVSGPAGVRCFFSGTMDSEWWLTAQFSDEQDYTTPYIDYFATKLWCYLPVKDVVRIMIAPEVEKGHMIDVRINSGVMGEESLGTFPLGYTVDRLYMIDGEGIRCRLVNKDRRLADVRSGRVFITVDSPLVETQLGRWGSITCLRMFYGDCSRNYVLMTLLIIQLIGETLVSTIHSLIQEGKSGSSHNDIAFGNYQNLTDGNG